MNIRDYATEHRAKLARQELMRLGWTVSHIWYDNHYWHLITNK